MTLIMTLRKENSMIDLDKTLSIYNITKVVGNDKGKIIIFEKYVYSLLLLEQLNKLLEGYHYVFKGGTSILLLIQTSSRFSIDIDLSTDESLYDKRDELEKRFKSSIKPPFTNVTRDSDGRSHGGRMIKAAHYRLFYNSKYDTNENYVLLDIVFQTNSLRSKPVIIDNPVVIQDGEPLTVNTIEIDDLLGDKLTAFAPNTIGVKYTSKNKYGRAKSCEIIKQLFDCAFLTKYMSDYIRVSEVYLEICNYQIKCENNNQLTISKCLVDTLRTCETILSNGKTNKENYALLLEGMRSFNDYKIGKPLTIIDLQKCALAVGILAGRLLNKYNPSIAHENKLDYLLRTGIKEKELQLIATKEEMTDFVNYFTLKTDKL